MKRDVVLQLFGEPAQVFNYHDVHLEALGQQSPRQVVKHSFHPTPIEVLDDVSNAQRTC